MDTTRAYFIEYDCPDERVIAMTRGGDLNAALIAQIMPLLAAHVREIEPTVATFRNVRLVRGEQDPRRMSTRFRLEAILDTYDDKPDEKRADAVSRDFEVTLTVEAGQVIAAIEALTASLMRLGLIAEYPPLALGRLADVTVGVFIASNESTLPPADDLAGKIQAVDTFAALEEFTPLSPERLAEAAKQGRRLKIAMWLADSFPYAVWDIRPLVDITQDEVLIRSVLGDYVGQKDGLAQARETLLAMREDDDN